MKLKNIIRAFVISLLAITTIITTLAPAVPVAAATKYESFTLTSKNAYKAGLCEKGETLSGDIVIPETFEYGGKKYKITAIGKNAFQSNKKITSVEIPSTVKKIGSHAFFECTKLKTIKMSKMDSIGDSAFAYCSSLKKVIINAKTVGEYAFLRCSSLEKVTFGDNVKKIGGACFQETALKSINFGKNITEIGHDAVSGCDSLKTLTIGENVTTLGHLICDDSFNLKTIIIKSEKLDPKKCGTMGGPNGDWYLTPFGQFNVDYTIKLPKSKLSTYKKIIDWDKYKIETF